MGNDGCLEKLLSFNLFVYNSRFKFFVLVCVRLAQFRRFVFVKSQIKMSEKTFVVRIKTLKGQECHIVTDYSSTPLELKQLIAKASDYKISIEEQHLISAGKSLSENKKYLLLYDIYKQREPLIFTVHKTVPEPTLTDILTIDDTMELRKQLELYV